MTRKISRPREGLISTTTDNRAGKNTRRRLSWAPLDTIAYGLVHVSCLGALFIAPRMADLILGLAVLLISSFGVSVGWHRYLSHRAFETGRISQFIIVACGALAGMKGPLWFAQHHGAHHRNSDRQADIHSPWSQGFAYSHVGWFLNRRHRMTDYGAVRRWTRFRELVWLNETCTLVSAAIGAIIFFTLGAGALIWGYLIPVVLTWHGFKSIGSFCHGGAGYRRYATPDLSCNQPLVSVFTFGEGWHNNHHFVPYSAKLGVAWWEFDPGWWAIRAMEAAGIVWNVKRPPADAADPRSRLAARHVRRFIDPLGELEATIVAALDQPDPTRLKQIREACRRFTSRAMDAFAHHPGRLPALREALASEIEAVATPNEPAAANIRHRLDAILLNGRFAHLWRRPFDGTSLATTPVRFAARPMRADKAASRQMP